MQPKYHGPFQIQGRTNKGNYWLVNDKGEKLNKSYPLSRLKVVVQAKDENTTFEVEKIIDHRTRNGKIEYFVKWKSFSDDENTWEPETHFNTTECIEEYWKTKNKPAVINYARRTIPNILSKSILLMMMIFTFFDNSCATTIIDTFKYCEVYDNKVTFRSFHKMRTI